jgi:signal transduction histidine kinase
VQESLTNALKYGGPGRTEVAIGYEPKCLHITVASPLASVEPALPAGGAGIIGMRERAHLLGGEFDAGPHDGRWRVTARLPIEPAPA